MSAWNYAALDKNGRERRGVLQADTARQVRQQLREQGMAPLRIDAAVEKRQQQGGEEAGYRGRSPSLKAAELALLTRQLATLLQSSMPLEESLRAVARQSENRKVAALLLSVRARVLEGFTLADSLALFPRAFPQLYRATVAAGEHAGHLDLILANLADYTENAHQSRQKIQLALLYPMILFFLALAIVTGLMSFVVPDVVEVFVGQGQQLPMLTRALIAVSDFVVNYGLLTLLLLGLAGVLARLLWTKPEVQVSVDRRLLRLPLIGRFSRGVNSARFASTLSILTSSGVPLVDAMSIAGEVLSNRYLKQTVREATQQVREGGSLYRALEKSGYFPPLMVYMIASGESSGELDQMLRRVAETQQRELDSQIATLIGIFEPAMLLFMGATVLLIVVAILQPIFDLNQLI